MGGGGNETQTQRTEIPDELKPLASTQGVAGAEALSRLRSQLGNAGADELVAPFNPLQQQAQQQAIGFAGGEGGFLPTAQDVFMQTAQGHDIGGFIDPAALGALRQTAQGDFLFGGEGFDQAVQASLRAAQPSILSTFGGSGRGTGGLAQTAMSQAATDAFARQFGDERQRQLQASSALSQLGNAERQRQIAAAGSLPGLGLLSSDILAQIGAQQQAQSQAQLMAPITAQEMLLSASGGSVPMSALLGGSITGGGGGGSKAAAGMSGALGGAATGAAIGSVVPGIGTAFGALGGAILGGGGGLLS